MLTLRLTFQARGQSLAEVEANAHAICTQFYGETPYRFVLQPWEQAQGEHNEDTGELRGFLWIATAEAVPEPDPA